MYVSYLLLTILMKGLFLFENTHILLKKQTFSSPVQNKDFMSFSTLFLIQIFEVQMFKFFGIFLKLSRQMGELH